MTTQSNPVANYAADLAAKIENRTAKVAIIGLGYVGLPLAVEFANAGFSVTGIDLDKSKVQSLNEGRSYIQDVQDEELAKGISAGKFRATSDFASLREVDTVSICVPTPLRKTKDPDISYIVSATESIANNGRPGQLIILESTTYP